MKIRLNIALKAASLVITAFALRAELVSAQDSADSSKNWYVDSKSVGTRRDTEPPRYVQPGDKLPDGIDLGAEYRMRYEYRDGDLRRPVTATDNPLLHRTRGYLGVRKLLDPLRFGVEVQESRRANSQFPADDRDVNHLDILQSFAELYFENALGEERPFRVQAGRLAFEYLDRRLVARNEWRNTTNTFDGIRTILGQEKNDWQVDLLALRPIRRDIVAVDSPDQDRQLYGMIGNWRRWSEVTTIQPYYFFLDQDRDETRPVRQVHTVALRSYGVFGKGSPFDYDVDVATQFGHSDTKAMRALAATFESGYTFDAASKPRLSGFIGYASGDDNPDDGMDQHFERLFGFSRPWSANDYVSWENVIAPKVRLDIQPSERVKLDGGYGAFFLASDTDSWANTNLRDKTGKSGSFMGHEIDIRSRIHVNSYLDVTLGYSHFISGRFVTDQGKAGNTDFFYCETSFRFL